ncbi:UDP-N-acetylmuramate dehydrogenase [soil metagenome]
MTAATARLADRLGSLVRRDVPLGPLTTYRVGGPAALLAKVADIDEMRSVAHAVAGTGVATLVIGRGSNLLVADDGFDGLALVLGDGFSAVEINGTTVAAGGAASLPVVARRTAKAGLTGFEWAVGVPGSVGGAVRMNAGGHGSDMAATVRGIHVLDLATCEDGEVPVTDLAFGYRCSAIGPSQVVVRADLGLQPGEVTAAEAEISEIVRWRRAHQPGGTNAGSVFTNPPGDSAGRLVEVAGCKGLRVGTAEVSNKHDKFIQADDGGRAADVAALMGEVRSRVATATGVNLHPETHLIWFPPRAHPQREVNV